MAIRADGNPPPPAYERWTDEEEQRLVALHATNIDISDMQYGREVALKKRELEAAADHFNREERAELQKKMECDGCGECGGSNHITTGGITSGSNRINRWRARCCLRILSVNILVKHQLIIDIHPQHHQYLNCNIFCLCVMDRATRAVEEMTPNQAHESSPMVWG